MQSRILVIWSPPRWSARSADSRPDPGPRTKTVTERSPNSRAFRAASSPATWAANGVDLREPLKPLHPELDQAITPPVGSVIVTIVLLKVAWMCATPTGTFRFAFFLRAPAVDAAPAAGFASAKISSLAKNYLALLSKRLTSSLQEPSFR